MDASHLFTAALRLRSPWRVGSADFRDADVDGREPHITIGFEPGRGFMLLFEAWVWLYRLCSWMMHSRLEPMKELARLFRRHFATIIYLTCGSSHINGSSDCDAQEQLRARLDCLLEPTGAGIDDLVDTPAGIWWGFRWHTGFQANPATKTAAKKPAKKKVSAFSARKVDPAYYWMVVPAAIIFVFFLYLPFLDGVKYSFTNSQGYGDYKFIGLKNYIALFQDNRVGHAYLFTFLIAILITVLINVIALFLSVLLNSKIAFKNGFRAIFFIPYTLSVLVIGYVFKYIFMNPLPELGKALGIKWLSTSLLTNEQLSWIPIVFLAVWQGIAYSVLIYLAGLQTIDDEIYEAAAIDGVNAWQKFWKITFPLIGPFFTINLVLSMKNALGTFDQVVALTEGGPNSSTETVTYLIWKGGLTGGEYAYQTANAVLFFIVLAIIAFVQLRISRSQEQI